VEGPAISPGAPDATFTFPLKHSYDDDSTRANSFANTASFIHPFNTLVSHEYDFSDRPKPRPEDHQPISAFDFDALPPRISNNSTTPVPAPKHFQPQHDISVFDPDVEYQSKTKPSARSLIGYLQSKCNIKWQLAIDAATNKDMDSPANVHTPQQLRRRVEKRETVVRTQFKRVKSVPAFASPLTRILSPIVVRGQWEIVIRSSVIALLVTWIILGSLLAVPVAR
jgi:hypothetical protein